MNYQVICKFLKPYVSVYGTTQNNSFCITTFVLIENQCISPYVWEKDYRTPLKETLPLVETYKYLKNATS